MNTNAPLRFGSRAGFQDRWEGTLAAFEVDENWEALNVVVRRGILRWTSSVKLPLSAATGWSDGQITFGCTSTQAFARELIPSAALARTFSAGSPIGLAGAVLVGALVGTSRRIVSEIIIRHDGNEHRIPAADVTFDGRTMRLGVQADVMAVYRSDTHLQQAVQATLAAGRILSPEDRRWLSVEASGGVVRLRGNMRSPRSRIRAGRAISGIAGVTAVQNDIVDDASVEQAVGQALHEAGLQRTARVYVRSSLGKITLSGYAPSAALAAEVLRVVSLVPGVRATRSLLETSGETAATGR